MSSAAHGLVRPRWSFWLWITFTAIPAEVQIGIYIVDLDRVDNVDQSFRAQAIVTDPQKHPCWNMPSPGRLLPCCYHLLPEHPISGRTKSTYSSSVSSCFVSVGSSCMLVFGS